MIARNRSVGQDRLGRSRSLTIARYILTACRRYGAISLLLSRYEIGFWIDVPLALEAALNARDTAAPVSGLGKKYIPAYKLTGTY